MNEERSLHGIHSNLTVEQLDEWAAFYAREEGEGENIWASAQWLHFKVADQQFILPMTALDEVSTVTLGVGLPHLPPAAIGLINLRGETVLTFDLGQMLGLRGSIAPSSKQRVLLFKESGDEALRTAFLIDEIITVTDLDESRLQPLHDSEALESNRYPWCPNV